MLAGRRIGRYVVVRELARGGMGLVLQARAPDGERVALKLILDSAAALQGLERFQVEAQASARIQHPNVVRVLDAGADQGRPFLVMEMLDGPSLQSRLKLEGPLRPREAARVTAEVARGLAHCHANGVLHRDLKPANVIQVGERAVLTDFGLARDAAFEKERLTRTGQVMGTPGFMSPEQANGDVHAVDERSDVYGLGAMLYALLSGRAPFKGPSALATLTLVLEKVPRPPKQAGARIPAALEAICLRCLEKDPARRYASAGALADALEDFLHDAAPRRIGARAALIVGGGLACALLGGGLLLRISVNQPGANPPLREPPADPPPTDPSLARKKEADTEYRRGEALRDEGRLAEAVVAFTRAIELDPEHGRAHLERGFTRARVAGEFNAAPEDLSPAIEDLERAVELLPGDSHVLWVLGWVYKFAHRFHDQRDVLERAVAIDPKHPGAWWQIVELQAASGDLSGAIARGERALPACPPEVQHTLLLAATLGELRRVLEARDLLRARRWEEAESIIGRLGQDPRIGRYGATLARRLQGHLLQRRTTYVRTPAEFESAVRLLEESVAMDPRDADAHALLALVRWAQRTPGWKELVDPALEAGRGSSVLALVTDGYRRLSALAPLRSRPERYAAAHREVVAFCERAIALDPRCVDAQYLLVYAWQVIAESNVTTRREELLETMAAAAQRALDVLGEEPLIQNRLGWTFKERGVACLRRAAASGQQGLPDGGESQRATELLQRALAEHERTLRSAPYDTRSYIERAETRRYLGDTAGAVTDLEQAARLEPNSAWPWWLMALYQQPTASPAEREGLLRECLKREPDYLPAHLEFLTARAKSDPAGALAEARALREGLSPTHYGLDQLLRLIAQLEDLVSRRGR